jgi:hypothetical protein
MEIEKLAPAQIAFNVPSDMKRDEAANIELLLDVHKTIEELKSSITEEGARVGQQVKFSNRMEARLSGPHFQISTSDPEVRAVEQQETVKWTWAVVPTARGKQTLHLTLSAYVLADGAETPTIIRTFDRDIDVHVTAGQWLADTVSGHWEWLATTLVIPAAGFAWSRRRRKGQNSPPSK